MGLSNYPDGMDWGAYDDYHDPALECGHRSSDSCDCWCEHYLGEGKQHLVGECDSENCELYSCEICGEEKQEEESLCQECNLELEGE